MVRMDGFVRTTPNPRLDATLRGFGTSSVNLAQVTGGGIYCLAGEEM